MISAQLHAHWDKFVSALDGIELITQAHQVAKLSQDYHNFSPVLHSLLCHKRGDVVVRPQNQAEVLQVAALCVRYRIPLTIRGAGTGNYGQCVPLEGGVILDLTRMQTILDIKPGWVKVEPGVRLAQINKVATEIGWELRLLPSTYRTATIGGFVAGGSGGIGSVLYGWLGDRGNILAAKVVTLQDPPQLIELRGDDLQKVNHAYGTNGIIVELEMPLAPHYPWAEVIAIFADFMSAVRFGKKLGESDGLIAKLISIHAWPIPTYFAPLQFYLPKNHHAALIVIAENGLEPLVDLVNEFGGKITYSPQINQEKKALNLAEFTWNHTTLHARAIDSNLTYLQSMFSGDRPLESVAHLYNYFGEEVMMHLEMVRSQGRILPCGLQLVQFSTEKRLNQMIEYHEQQGVSIANPHTYILEDGGRKTINYAQLNFKRQVDPEGLLNPGKMRAWYSP